MKLENGINQVDVERIMKGMNCPKDFKCAKSNFENLYKAQEFGMGGKKMYLCQEKSPKNCTYSEGWGGDPAHPHNYLCRCSMRIYLIKELGK